MRKYPKINSVFMRDPATNHRTFTEEYAHPAFEYLKGSLWEWTEKVDGTNIRIEWDPGISVCIGGRNENSQTPPHLLDYLQATFSPDALAAALPEADTRALTLYGEGYGPKIQKGGELYRPTPGFILFDVQVGDLWLERSSVVDIASKLSIPVAPVLLVGTIDEAIAITRDVDMPSVVSTTLERRRIEGLVGRPKVTLLDRQGNRIITKLKVKDFPR